MANCNITSRSPFAQSFFLAKCYNPILPARLCASRQCLSPLKPPDSIGLMETLCMLILYRPTLIKHGHVKAGLMCERLPIDLQRCLSWLGASTKDAKKRVLHTAFLP